MEGCGNCLKYIRSRCEGLRRREEFAVDDLQAFIDAGCSRVNQLCREARHGESLAGYIVRQDLFSLCDA